MDPRIKNDAIIHNLLDYSKNWTYLTHNLFLPPVARQVEETNFLESGYWDIRPPGAGRYYY